MTLLYTNPVFLQHDTGQHPERAQRLVQITAHLARTGLDVRCRRPEWQAVSPERLVRVHSLDYAHYVERFADQGGERIEEDTVVCPASYQVALQAAGAVCDAVEKVVQGNENRALCLVRPPGHHALPDRAMGFCLFNSVAVGARMAIREFGLDRVLIVDWDVHHGNGTQDMFWTDEQVGFMSIHRWPFYPGTGWKTETGTGAALGTTFNLPIEMGIARSEYIKCLADELERFADKIRPQLIILSAGFDSHRDDPIGSLGLETEDFQPLTQAVLNVAAAHAGGKLVSVLEGGYNCSALAGSVEVHLRELLAADETEVPS